MARNPQSRVESILQSTIDGTPYTARPQSRVEEDLLELKAVIEAGGGGSGTRDYNLLINKPSINDKVIKGDLSTSDLGIERGYDVNVDPTDGEHLILTN